MFDQRRRIVLGVLSQSPGADHRRRRPLSHEIRLARASVLTATCRWPISPGSLPAPTVMTSYLATAPWSTCRASTRCSSTWRAARPGWAPLPLRPHLRLDPHPGRGAPPSSGSASGFPWPHPGVIDGFFQHHHLYDQTSCACWWSGPGSPIYTPAGWVARPSIRGSIGACPSHSWNSSTG